MSRFRSNIFPFGHQMRDFNPAIVQDPRRGANVLTGLMHPSPNFMPFTSSIDCANADVLRKTNAAAMDMRSMATLLVGGNGHGAGLGVIQWLGQKNCIKPMALP